MGMDNIFFLLPSKGKFLGSFAHNEQLMQQADHVWRQLDGLAPWLLIGSVAIGIGLCVWYYTGYNNRPGRHYKVKHWVLWMLLAFTLTLAGTLLVEYLGIQTSLRHGIGSLYWRCAINNVLYSVVLYVLISLVWCNFGRTNAYKFLKL